MTSMEGPIVSAIIPTYNRAEFAAQAVESALAQTYPRLEIIVVDDGSTDNTRQVLERYLGRIRYIYQERSERSKSRNVGFSHSKGDYIAFLDSDDLWLPTKTEEQVQVLDEHGHVGLVYTDVELVDETGNTYRGDLTWDTPRREVLYEDLMTHNVITGSTSSVMIRRSCLERVGLFDEEMNACEDLDLFRRIARYYEFYKIWKPLVKIRIHDDNTQGETTTMAKGWESTISKILENTPPEFEHYKHEAIVKILAEIARLYWRGGRPDFFVGFCARSIVSGPNWIMTYSFWRNLFRMSWKRLLQNA